MKVWPWIVLLGLLQGGGGVRCAWAQDSRTDLRKQLDALSAKLDEAQGAARMSPRCEPPKASIAQSTVGPASEGKSDEFFIFDRVPGAGVGTEKKDWLWLSALTAFDPEKPVDEMTLELLRRSPTRFMIALRMGKCRFIMSGFYRLEESPDQEPRAVLGSVSSLRVLEEVSGAAAGACSDCVTHSFSGMGPSKVRPLLQMDPAPPLTEKTLSSTTLDPLRNLKPMIRKTCQ